MEASRESLEEVDDVGPIVAAHIQRFLRKSKMIIDSTAFGC